MADSLYYIGHQVSNDVWRDTNGVVYQLVRDGELVNRYCIVHVSDSHGVREPDTWLDYEPRTQMVMRGV